MCIFSLSWWSIFTSNCVLGDRTTTTLLKVREGVQIKRTGGFRVRVHEWPTYGIDQVRRDHVVGWKRIAQSTGCHITGIEKLHIDDVAVIILCEGLPEVALPFKVRRYTAANQAL